VSAALRKAIACPTLLAAATVPTCGQAQTNRYEALANSAGQASGKCRRLNGPLSLPKGS
jgi:hypothetical protein